jgi:hypothetical protein
VLEAIQELVHLVRQFFERESRKRSDLNRSIGICFKLLEWVGDSIDIKNITKYLPDGSLTELYCY